MHAQPANGAGAGESRGVEAVPALVCRLHRRCPGSAPSRRVSPGGAAAGPAARSQHRAPPHHRHKAFGFRAVVPDGAFCLVARNPLLISI